MCNVFFVEPHIVPSKSSTPATCVFRRWWEYIYIAGRRLQCNEVCWDTCALVSWSPVKTPPCCVGKVLEPQMQPLSSSPTRPPRWRSEHSKDRLECALRKRNNHAKYFTIIWCGLWVLRGQCFTLFFNLLKCHASILCSPCLANSRIASEENRVLCGHHAVLSRTSLDGSKGRLHRHSGSKNAKWTPRILIHFQFALTNHGSSVAAKLWYVVISALHDVGEANCVRIGHQEPHFCNWASVNQWESNRLWLRLVV